MRVFWWKLFSYVTVFPILTVAQWQNFVCNLDYCAEKQMHVGLVGICFAPVAKAG